MQTVAAEAHCKLPPRECWEKLRDFGAASNYVPGVTHIEFVGEQREGVGACRIAHSKAMSIHETVTEWTEGKGFVIRLHKGEGPPSPMKEATFRYAIEPAGSSESDGTRIVLTMSFAFGLGPLGAVIGRIARGAMQKNLDAIAPRLAQYWETGEPVE